MPRQLIASYVSFKYRLFAIIFQRLLNSRGHNARVDVYMYEYIYMYIIIST